MNTSPAFDPRGAVVRDVERIARGPSYDVQEVCRVGAAAHQLGMAREASLMFRLAVEILHHLVARGKAAEALMTESQVYNTFVKAVETEEHYERSMGLWREAMANLGRSYRAPLPPLAAGSPGGVGFILPTGVVLGHTEVLLRLLEKRAAGMRVHLYVLFGSSAEFEQRARALGVPVEIYRGTPEGPAQWLRTRMAANGEDCAVWVSSPPTAHFMFAARVAPLQVFWTLRYHAVRLPEIDGYITYGSWGERTRTFHGQEWIVCPVPLALDPRPPDPAQVEALRARFPERRLLGTLAREEKIDSRPFLGAVAEILRRNPDCGYVWTGREPHRGIEAFFREAGVGARCHFVGWVDTPLYAAILDVFLETFPLGCGITGYQALGAGVPLVSYLDANTVFGMQYWNELAQKAGDPAAAPRELLDGYPVLVARSPAEYAELATRLLADEAFRDGWKARERRFYDEEIAGIERYSQRFFGALEAIRSRGAATR